MGTFAALVLILLLGFGAYVRLAPSDPTLWNSDPSQAFDWDQDGGWNKVVAQINSAALRIPASDGLLARLDAIALATPNTTRFAGSVEEGRITWVTRSALWGFPDYTTAQTLPDGLYLFARARFGKSDLGVNAVRLRDWLSKL